MNIDEVTRWLTTAQLKPEDITKLPQLVLAATAHEVAHQNIASAENKKPKADDDELWTPEELAGLLKQTKRWIYEHAANGHLPFARYLNGQSKKGLRFSKKGYQRWLDSRVNQR